MDDVRGDVLGPPHGTAPVAVAVIANKKQTWDPLITVSILMKRRMVDIAVSAS